MRRLALLCGAAVICAAAYLVTVWSGGGFASQPGGGLPAFPGAEGFGAQAVGGRGGRVLTVTSLEDEGPGTLRWALEEVDEPRIVIFAVGGVVELSREIDVAGRVTVAGQTAPGDGIVVRGARLHVVGDDVVIRGMKFRPGAGPGQDLDARDGLSIGRADGTVRRVIVDGNSFAWAPDENVATWYEVADISITGNLIAEALEVPVDSGRERVSPSLGLLIGDGAERVTVADNLLVGNTHRNPQVKGSTAAIEIVNNVVYDYGHNGTEVPKEIDGPATLHVIGNVYKPGPRTVDRPPVQLRSGGEGRAYYLDDNLWLAAAPGIDPGTPGGADRTGMDVAAGEGLDAVRPAPVFETSGIAALPADVAARRVPALAHARGRVLDAVDARLIGAVLEGTVEGADGGRTDPVAPEYHAPVVRATWTDGDGDGIPDEAEAGLGTDPVVADAEGDADGDGYSNIEAYVNGLMDGTIQHPEHCAGPDPRAIAAAFERGADPDAPVGPGETRIEAEAMTLERGFVVDANGFASGARVIRAEGADPNADLDADMARARLVLDVPEGRYDLSVIYFDEADGVSVMGLKLDGRLVDLWAWNRAGGTDFVGAASRTERRIPCLDLAPGMELELFGTADAGEPLRVDTIRLSPGPR